MSDNRVPFTYDQYRAARWSRDEIISGAAGPVLGRIPLEGEPSLASGDHYSYPSLYGSQSFVSGSHHSSANSRQNSNAGGSGRHYGPTFDSPNIAQPQPQTTQQFQQYSPPLLSINSSALNPSIIDPQEVQDYGTLEAAHNYAQRQSTTRDFVESQRQISPPSRAPSSIHPQSTGSPATWEQLHTEIPGAKYIPLKDKEPPMEHGLLLLGTQDIIRGSRKPILIIRVPWLIYGEIHGRVKRAVKKNGSVLCLIM